MSTPPRADRAIEETDRFRPRFDAAGLMPCIAVDAATGEVLMLAWISEAALAETLTTGFSHYWSRSRGALWKKGETSGAVQKIVDVRTDCDQDAVLYRVEVALREGTCHTGRTTCFYRRVRPGPGGLDRPLDFDPDEGGSQ